MSRHIDMTPNIPTLYNFRRCPYAMRARLAILASGVEVQVREIELKHKPKEMLAISPKGTVPVLQQTDGSVLDESVDISYWALALQDPFKLTSLTLHEKEWQQRLIAFNDGEFKHWLDRYKYFDRFPEFSQSDYFAKASVFLLQLEHQLASQSGNFLLGRMTIADLLVMPFVRQFAFADEARFAAADWPHLQKWLADWLVHPWFVAAMKKRPIWSDGSAEYLLALS